METLYIVLIALLIIHVLLFIYIKFHKELQDKGLVPYGPLIMIKTQWGIKLIDRLGKYKRFWRVCGIISRFVTFLLMVWIVAILVIDVIAVPSLIGKSGLGIQYALAIPGLNPMLPIVYGWIGLIVAMVIHELAHGMQTRANDMTVKSTGILWGVVPLGAFVEPDDEQVQKCSRRARLDLYAAGITTNFIAAVVMFIIVFAGMTCCVSSDYGDNAAVYAVASDSPGYNSGIPATAIIIEIDGTSVDTLNEMNAYLSSHGFGTYNITYIYHNETKDPVSVKMGVYIHSVVKDSPAEKANLKSGMFIKSIDGQSFGLAADFSSFMKQTVPDQVVTVAYEDKDGVSGTAEVKLSNNNGVGYLGITTSTSGFSFSTPNIVRDIGINPFYGCNTVTEYAMGALGYIGNAFNGYSPVPESTHWWYQTNGINSDVFWILMSAVFWIMWLNLVLGVTNAIPAMPFDGGFIFIGGLDFILEKFKMEAEKREKIVGTIGHYVSIVMIMILILVMVVIII